MRISDWSSDVCSSDLEVGLIKTEQTNPDGSTSTGVGSVTTASLVQLNQATNEATASRIAAEEKWRAIEKTPLLSIPDVLANKAIQDLLNQRAQATAALSQERAKHLEAYPTVQPLKAQVDEVNRQIQTIAKGIKQSIRPEYE